MMSTPAEGPLPPDDVTRSLSHARSKVALLVHPVQQHNPVLRHIRHVRKEVHPNLPADFICGPTTCVLYLSLQYHTLHPGYIYTRLASLHSRYRLRVLLVLADLPAHRPPVHELAKLSLRHSLTLVCCASEREAARYLETLRSYAGKGAEGIQQRPGDDFSARLVAALGAVRGVTRTDVATLAYTFGSFADICKAGAAELRACPGIGERKVERLFAALHQPFRGDGREGDG